MDAWERRFGRESELLLRVLGDGVVAIEHVGSTAVPGLGGRPILDVLVGLRGREPTPAQLAGLASAGYRPPRRRASRLYVRRGSPRTVTVHFAQWGGSRWWRLVGFRDALRADPGLARRYDELKGAAAAGSPAEYAETKKRFVERELQRLASERR